MYLLQKKKLATCNINIFINVNLLPYPHFRAINYNYQSSLLRFSFEWCELRIEIVLRSSVIKNVNCA